MTSAGGEIRGMAAVEDKLSANASEAAESVAYRERVAELFNAHLDLVEAIARHVSRAIDRVVEFDELLAAGREGLFDAARRFDAKRGLPFRAFAGFRVEGAIVDAVRKSFRLPRRLYERLAEFESMCSLNEGECVSAMRPAGSYGQSPPPERALSSHLAAMATAAAVTRDRGVSPDSAADERPFANPEEAYSNAELIGIVRSAMAELDKHQAEIIRLYYFEGKSFESAAAAMDISKPWANRLHSRGIEILTKRLRTIDR